MSLKLDRFSVSRQNTKDNTMTNRTQEPIGKTESTICTKTQTAVITVLGITQNPERKVSYALSPDLQTAFSNCNIQESYEYASMIPLLITLFPESEYEIIPIATEKAKESQEKVLLAEFGESNQIHLDKTILIDENDYGSIFQTVNQLITNYSKVIIDMTHGFRHLPILMMGSIFVELIKENNKIEHILFAKEIEYQKSYQVVDLIEYLSILNEFVVERKEKERAEAELKAQKEKYQERDNVIRKLFHEIKNITSSAITSLKQVEENEKFQDQANRIRVKDSYQTIEVISNLVNMVNESYKVSVDNLKMDAKNLSQSNTNLKEIIIDSIRYSLDNILFRSASYGIYTKFCDKYFPDYKKCNQATEEWNRVSVTKDEVELEKFLNTYFFKTEFQFSNFKNYHISNEYYSATNFLLVLQEIIFNAIKYSSFVKAEERVFRVIANHNDRQVSIIVENRYDTKKLNKIPGFGHLAIENSEKFFGCKPITKTDNGLYTILINFENFWEKKAPGTGGARRIRSDDYLEKEK